MAGQLVDRQVKNTWETRPGRKTQAGMAQCNGLILTREGEHWNTAYEVAKDGEEWWNFVMKRIGLCCMYKSCTEEIKKAISCKIYN